MVRPVLVLSAVVALFVAGLSINNAFAITVARSGLASWRCCEPSGARVVRSGAAAIEHSHRRRARDVTGRSMGGADARAQLDAVAGNEAKRSTGLPSGSRTVA